MRRGHEYGKCEKGAEIKCCNCGGGHSSAYAGCPVQQEAREIQKVKTMQKLMYAEATAGIKRVNEQGISVESYIQKNVNPARNESDLHFMMNKIDFVAFICAVINGTSQVERNSDKLKIIEECANKFLKVTGVSAEEDHGILKKKKRKEMLLWI